MREAAEAKGRRDKIDEDQRQAMDSIMRKYPTFDPRTSSFIAKLDECDRVVASLRIKSKKKSRRGMAPFLWFRWGGE